MPKKLKQSLPFVSAVILITAMAAAAELTGEREILFPEIAAIAAGSLISPGLKWNTSAPRLYILIALGSVMGLLIVLYLPMALYLQMSLAFLSGSLMLLLSRTTFAPLISSVVLPVMLQTRSVIYPISAVILTAAIVLLRSAFEHMGLIAPSHFEPEPKPDKRAFFDMLIRWLCGSLVIIIAVFSGFKLAAAPPLLVAFTEFWKKGSAAQKKPFAVGSVIFLCALIGALLRAAFAFLGIYLFIAAGVSVVLVFAIMKRTGLFIPPAAALSILAFLIPSESVSIYPLLILTGTTVILLITKLRAKIIS